MTELKDEFIFRYDNSTSNLRCLLCWRDFFGPNDPKIDEHIKYFNHMSKSHIFKLWAALYHTNNQPLKYYNFGFEKSLQSKTFSIFLNSIGKGKHEI